MVRIPYLDTIIPKEHINLLRIIYRPSKEALHKFCNRGLIA
jgi:hypothetical protein